MKFSLPHFYKRNYSASGCAECVALAYAGVVVKESGVEQDTEHTRIDQRHYR